MENLLSIEKDTLLHFTTVRKSINKSTNGFPYLTLELIELRLYTLSTLLMGRIAMPRNYLVWIVIGVSQVS
jgi:hypothetical protein